jgi:hypothetical protein
MAKKTQKKTVKKSVKKKYSKPKMSRHGSLNAIAENVTGATFCCLTKRIQRAFAQPSMAHAGLSR